MEAKFTPGPWHWQGQGRFWEIYSGGTELTADGMICCINNPRETVTPEQRQANAALIAAAPDMYAALEKALPILEAHHAAGDKMEVYMKAVAALASARGEAGK
jgi:hypothetical protein